MEKRKKAIKILTKLKQIPIPPIKLVKIYSDFDWIKLRNLFKLKYTDEILENWELVIKNYNHEAKKTKGKSKG